MKKRICVLLAVLFTVCFLNIPVFADSARIALSSANVTVGARVTVSVSYSAGFEMYGIDGTLTYNNAVLKYVSGGSSNTGSAVKITEGLSGERSKTFNIVFKAIAAGSGSLSFSGEAAADPRKNQYGKASAGTAVNVTELKPSSNNNLGSLKLSDGELTPAFKAGTVNYTASVKYPIDKITISANAAAGDSKVAGVGTFDLKVGDNTRAITVTAASGDKKTYTIKIKRMTEEETAEAEKEEREKNPFLFVYNGSDRLIVPDLKNMTSFSGYTLSSAEIKGEQIGYFADKAGKYNLFWATDTSGANGAFYNRTESGEYEKVNYIQTDSNLYIIEPFPDDIKVSSQFVLSKRDINGETVECYQYSDVALSDYCVFYCYADGKNDYYRFDSAQNTVQREPTFLSAAADADAELSGSIIDKFKSLNTQAKILLGLLGFAGLLVLVLIVLLIIKAATGKKEYSDEEGLTEDIGIDEVDYADESVFEPEPEPASAQEDEIAEEIEPAAEIPDFEKPGETATSEGDLDTSEFIDLEDDF